MARRFGADRFQFEVVEGWPKQEIKGLAASVACDSRGRVYVGVRNIPPGAGAEPRLGMRKHEQSWSTSPSRSQPAG